MLYPPTKGPPPPSTGCACEDAVALMLHKLESTFEWETGWDYKHEDHYDSGEMINYRRIQHPVMKHNMFILIEYKKRSTCMIYAAGEQVIASNMAEFDEAIAAFDEPHQFKALAQKQKESRRSRSDPVT
jgi:hypothetical protein